MPFQPGQSGNPDGGARIKRFIAAIERAIAQDSGDRLRAAAEKLLDLAAAGESWALRELADRLDGKASQVVEAKIDNTGTVTHEHRSVSEIDGRIADLFASREVGDHPKALPN